jgi:hypothetical protein
VALNEIDDLGRTADAAGSLVFLGELDPTRASTNAHHARFASSSITAISVWSLADPLLDWEVLT